MVLVVLDEWIPSNFRRILTLFGFPTTMTSKNLYRNVTSTEHEGHVRLNMKDMFRASQKDIPHGSLIYVYLLGRSSNVYIHVQSTGHSSISFTSVLTENQITSEYDKYWRESTHLRQLIPSIELGRFIPIILLCRFVCMCV